MRDGDRDSEAVRALLGREGYRLVVRCLQERREPQTRGDLARHLVAESERFDSVERARIALHHCHLPKLAELGVVNYRGQEVWLAPDGPETTAPVAALSAAADEDWEATD